MRSASGKQNRFNLAPADFSDAYFERMESLEDRHPWTRAMRGLTLSLLKRQGGQPRSVLDAGCGTGLFLCQWRDSAGIPLAVGLDVFPAALRRARQRCNSTWVAGSAGALPFRAGSFDAIHSADVLQHLSLADSERAVDTFVELLRPGGWLVLRLRASRLFGNPPDVDESHSFRPRALRAALKSRGIEVVFLSRVNALPSLLAECAGFFRARPAASEPVQGIVCRQQSDPRSWLLDRYLSLERAWLLHSGFGLRFGHTLVCLARKPG